MLIVNNYESVLLDDGCIERKINFAVSIPREAKSAAVVLLVADWPIITPRAVWVCAYILVSSSNFVSICHCFPQVAIPVSASTFLFKIPSGIVMHLSCTKTVNVYAQP